MIMVDITYRDGTFKNYDVTDLIRIVGLKLNGQRPVKAYCYLFGSDESDIDLFIQLHDKCLKKCLHPVDQEIIISKDLQDLMNGN